MLRHDVFVLMTDHCSSVSTLYGGNDYIFKGQSGLETNVEVFHLHSVKPRLMFKGRHASLATIPPKKSLNRHVVKAQADSTGPLLVLHKKSNILVKDCLQLKTIFVQWLTAFNKYTPKWVIGG